MKGIKEGFIEFWEILTGVSNNERANILRLSVFLLLIGGIAWSVSNYLNAQKLSDLNSSISAGTIPARASSNNTDNINQISELSKTVMTTRSAGGEFAEAITGAKKNLFRPEPVTLVQNEIPEAENLPQVVIAPQVAIKAIMLSDRKRIAVIHAGNKRGLIVGQGDELPEGLGRITKISSDGIVISSNGHTFNYLIK